MQITIVGLGKMGLSLAKQLNEQGKEVNGFDINPKITDYYSNSQLKHLENIEELKNIKTQNIVFLVLPSGEPTQKTVNELTTLLKKDDIIIDFSNSFYKDSISNQDRKSVV